MTTKPINLRSHLDLASIIKGARVRRMQRRKDQFKYDQEKRRDFLMHWELGTRDYSGTDLSRADLSHLNLTGGIFRCCDLTLANLSYSIMHHCDLRDVCIEGAYIANTSFSDILFEGMFGYADSLTRSYKGGRPKKSRI